MVVGPNGATEGPAGSLINLDVENVPDGAENVYVDADGTRIGTLTVEHRNAAGALLIPGRTEPAPVILAATTTNEAHGRGLSIPGKAKPPHVMFTVSTHVDGSAPFASSRFAITAGLHRSSIDTAIPQPRQVSFAADKVLRTGAVAAAAIGLLFFPAELFDSTFAQNEARITAAFSRLRRRRRGAFVARDNHLRRRAVLVFCALFGGALFTALTTPIGFDSSTLMVLIGSTVAVALVDFGLAASDYFFMRRAYRARGVLKAIPSGLVVGVACVAAAKIVGFEPGYVYGVLAAWIFDVEPSKEDQGKMAALSTISMLALAIACWLIRVPVTPHASTGSVGWIALQTALTGTFLLALESAVISLIPLRFLRGHQIWVWNKKAWAATTFITTAVFIHILMTPGSGVIAKSDGSTIGVGLALAFFGVISVAFWAWFHFRPAPTLAATEASLLPETPGEAPYFWSPTEVTGAD